MISVCILTRDRPDTLRRCLTCLSEQTLAPDEVIIVDNSTSAASQEVALEFGGTIKTIPFQGGLGCQPLMRNEALQAARGDIVCFLDDDGFAEPEWLAGIAAMFADMATDGIGGRIIQGIEQNGEQRSPRGTFYFSPTRGAMGNFNMIFGESFPIDHVQGTNMAFRREALQAIGGWDPALADGYASFEEMDVCLGLRRAGRTILFHPSAIVVHGVNPRAGGMARELGASPAYARSYARNLAYITLKHCKMTVRTCWALGLGAPLLNSARCLVPLVEGRRRLALSPRRIGAMLAVWRGLVEGCWAYFKARPRGGSPLPPYEARD